MSSMPKVSTVEYSLPTGEQKSAVVIPVEFPIKGLSEEELEVLDQLSVAVSGMTPIFAQQQFPDALAFMRALLDFEKTVEGSDQKAVSDYISVVEAANAPWNKERQGFVFPVATHSMPKWTPLKEYWRILSGQHVPPVGRGLYPADIKKREFEALAEGKRIKNSVVRRNASGLEVVLDSDLFARELDPVLDALLDARLCSQDERLRAYLSGKARELTLGTEEAIEEGWRLWVENTGKIDFVLGTAVETLLDKLYGIRGVAQGTVQVVNPKYREISGKLLRLMPVFEQLAPWKDKREIEVDKLPKLDYVDVLCSAGLYNNFPLNFIAESLPDEENIIQKHGSKNMVLVNLQEAINGAGEMPIVAKEFFLPEEMSKYQRFIPRMAILMTSLHELGHRTGVLKGNSGDEYFGENYSILEEQRAELFSMWALPILVSEGIITPEEEMAGYYEMLTTIIFKGLIMAPLDHSGARNMMFHYFLDKGAILPRDNGKFVVAPDAMRNAVREQLGVLGDIRAEGNLEELQRLKGEYVRTDQQEVYKKRLKDLPVGRLPRFPEFERENGRLTGGLIYPEFRQQRSTLEHFI